MPIDPKDITYQTPEKDLPDYWPATADVTQIAERYIEQHHPHLDIGTIVFLFRKKANKTGDKLVEGKATNKGTKDRVIAQLAGSVLHFDIAVAWDLWKQADAPHREALIDHELCHCVYKADAKGNLKPSRRHHDFADFREIIARHGFWNQDLEIAAVTFAGQQDQLPLFTPAATSPSEDDQTTVTVRNLQTGRSVTMTGKEFEELPDKIARLPRRRPDEGKEATR